jgi:apolipoprotein N-acyltransferase
VRMHLLSCFLYLIAGTGLIIGNIYPATGVMFYFGIFLGTYLIQRGYNSRWGMYCFVLPYFIMLGFSVWNHVFPYYTGILIALLLGELFGRVLYNLLSSSKSRNMGLLILPFALFLFDFTFQRIPILRFIEMPPISAPLYNHTFILNTASVFGAQTALLLVTITISCAVKTIMQKKYVKPAAVIGLCCTFIIILCNIYKTANLHSNTSTSSIKIAAVQGSFFHQNTGNSDYREKLDYYVSLALEGDADITVFPETTLGVYDNQNLIDQSYRDDLITSAEKLGGTAVFVVTEGNSLTKSKEERFISALLIDNGEIKGLTRKRNLVPFGETNSYSKGTDYDVYSTPYGRIGICICYDINGGAVEKLKERGAEFILAPFNDSSFGLIYHNIHRYYPVMKAAECSIPIAVSNEDGISQLIDSNGVIHDELGYKEKGCIEYEITPGTTMSLYMIFGKYIEWLAALSALLFILRISLKHK